MSCFEGCGATFSLKSTLCCPDPAPRERAHSKPSQMKHGQPGQHRSSLESAADLMYSCPAGEGCLSAGPQWLHLHYSERAPSGAAGNMAHSSSRGLPACGESAWACLVAHWPSRSPWACEVLCRGSGVHLTHLGPFLQAHYLHRG